MSEQFLGWMCVVLCIVILVMSVFNPRRSTLAHACGECDHVGECGDYECRPGVDGWQLKAGAR